MSFPPDKPEGENVDFGRTKHTTPRHGDPREIMIDNDQASIVHDDSVKIT